jgi:hypothetical protein
MAYYGKELGLLDKARFLLELTRRRSREGHLTTAAQLAQMFWLKVRRGIGPGYYHVAGLWRRDIPWADKDGHLGSSEYGRRLAAINPDNYRKLSQSKIAEKAILQAFGVPTPRFLGFFHPLRGRSASGTPLTSVAELARLLEAVPLPRVCFKPVEGWGGKGFHAVDVRPGSGRPTVAPVFGSGWTALEEYVEKVLLVSGSEGWVLEEYLEQHERMRAFNWTSVNTMRIWVLRSGEGPPFLLGGYLRIGRRGSLVDNQTSGGLVARIDPATGTLGPATNGYVDRPWYAVHPDHAAPIEGETVPCWSEATSLATSTLMLFPNIRFAGFDIAVSSRSPVVIELNVSPDLLGQALMEVPLRPVLLA